MELYDKKYVYFEWEDKLEGKKVILAHTIKDIKEFVANGDKGRFFIAQKGDDLPFTNGICECEFAYYDPNYEVKKAYNEGKMIQVQHTGEGDWEDFVGVPNWLEDYNYRIKPEYNYRVVIHHKDGIYFVNDCKYYRKVLFTGTRDECNEWYENHKDIVDAVDGYFFDKVIEYKEKGVKNDSWRPINDVPYNWDFDHYEYRIKPETVEHEEPTKDRLITNEELAMWLAQGKGLGMDNNTERKFTSYDYWEGDKTVDYMNIVVRKWNDTEWNFPTYVYCFGDK